MLSVGDKLPAFSLPAVVSLQHGQEFAQISSSSYAQQWLVLFFWPMDFTFVCPTEIVEFGRMSGEFGRRRAHVLGASTDTQYVHLAWRRQHPDLRELAVPMLADHRRELTRALGILDRREGVAQRATFIADPGGIIRFVMVTDLNVGRNVREVLRVLDALQTGELTPCGWEAGQETLRV